MKLKNIGLAAIIAIVATVSSAQAADKMNLRYSQWLPAGWWGQAKMLYPWFKQVAKATEGRVNIQPTADLNIPTSRIPVEMNVPQQFT